MKKGKKVSSLRFAKIILNKKWRLKKSQNSKKVVCGTYDLVNKEIHVHMRLFFLNFTNIIDFWYKL